MLRISYNHCRLEYEAYRDEILACVDAALATGQALQGAAVLGLEQAFASLCDRRFAVSVASCTDALTYSLQAVDIQAGDEVLVTDFSFVASAASIVRAGARPVFVDIDPRSYHMDLDAAASAITDKTKAIVLVHLYGGMVNPDAAEQFASSHGLHLIEDAAQACGAAWEGRPAGSLGIASCFSFDPTKLLAAPGSGGMVLTDDERLAARIKRLRYHGKSDDGDFVETGNNSQLPTLAAEVLRFKLARMPEWKKLRRSIADRYIDRLGPLGLVEDNASSSVDHCYHKFVIRSDRRDALAAHLEENGIETKIHYATPLHQHTCFKAGSPAEDNRFRHASTCANTVLSLPIYPFLSDDAVEHVCNSIGQFFTH